MEDIFELPRPRKRAERVINDLDLRKFEGGVFDYKTLSNLGVLSENGYVDRILSPISTGKEADVFLGEGKGGHVAIKVFRLATASYFRNPTVLQYILGDERFKRIKKDPRFLIMLWAQKEFSNLKKAHEMGVRAPEPIAIEKNVLVMRFIGEGIKPAPQMLRVQLENPKKVSREIFEDMAKMHKGKLVHADLSEYNVLMEGNTPVMIDFSQGVPLSHPKAMEFLNRDVKNLCDFFIKRGLDLDSEKVLTEITDGGRIS
ncbi:MAG: serine protein kinase RIO [Candidatus Altiarchaeota archaeon]|nr:serine protein kinase RIO [Candidatus Altiarchaeota archaeon]